MDSSVLVQPGTSSGKRPDWHKHDQQQQQAMQIHHIKSKHQFFGFNIFSKYIPLMSLEGAFNLFSFSKLLKISSLEFRLVCLPCLPKFH